MSDERFIREERIPQSGATRRGDAANAAETSAKNRSLVVDCEGCEAPCCRRQFMEDARGWFSLADARPIYLDAGTDVKVVGWFKQKDGRQPMLECQAFDKKQLRCTVYEQRPEHCRTYDCRDDDPDEWQARAHCDLARHQRIAAMRAGSGAV